jgi:hypothetical protein
MGLTAMAEASGISHDVLAWTSEWYLREPTLRAANAAIVDYQHALPMSPRFGSGTLSSSDGQRFPMRGKSLTARHLSGISSTKASRPTRTSPSAPSCNRCNIGNGAHRRRELHVGATGERVGGCSVCVFYLGISIEPQTSRNNVVFNATPWRGLSIFPVPRIWCWSMGWFTSIRNRRCSRRC